MLYMIALPCPSVKVCWKETYLSSNSFTIALGMGFIPSAAVPYVVVKIAARGLSFHVMPASSISRIEKIWLYVHSNNPFVISAVLISFTEYEVIFNRLPYDCFFTIDSERILWIKKFFNKVSIPRCLFAGYFLIRKNNLDSAVIFLLK